MMKVMEMSGGDVKWLEVAGVPGLGMDVLLFVHCALTSPGDGGLTQCHCFLYFTAA